jgi:hypothetical protein
LATIVNARSSPDAISVTLTRRKTLHLNEIFLFQADQRFAE